MNTQTHTKNDRKDKRSKSVLQKKNIGTYSLQKHENYIPPKLSFNNTVSNDGPDYLENSWSELAQGRVTDEHKILVKNHCKKLGMDEKTIDSLMMRDPQNLLHLSQLI